VLGTPAIRVWSFGQPQKASRVLTAVPELECPLISAGAWLPQRDPDRPTARAKAPVTAPQAPTLAAPCGTGTEAARGLSEAAAGTWSSSGLSLLYHEYFFLSKTPLPSQSMLHERYPIPCLSSF